MPVWSVLAACLVADVLVAAVLRWAFRSWAVRVERGAGERADKVHRLRRGQVVGSFIALPCGLVLAAAQWVYILVQQPRGSFADTGVAVFVVAGLDSLVCYILPFIAVYAAVRPAYARLLSIPVRGANQGRGIAVGVLFALVFPGLWLIALLVAPNHGPWQVIALVVAVVLSVLLLNWLLVPLWLVALRARALPTGRDERLSSLASHMGVRLRGIRAFAGRQEKVANALQVGMLPGLRYVLVSDYLLDNMADEQVDAVVAHEFAHIRGRHLLIKLGLVFGALIILEGLVVVVSIFAQGFAAGALVVVLVVVLLFGPRLVGALVGVRLEKHADGVAAREVGREPLAAALERLAELNDTRRRTGRTWAVLTQHPGLQQRIDALREATTQGGRV